MKRDETIKLGVIGGSGLYSMPGLSDIKEMNLDTPFGQPSSPIIIGSLEEKRVAFLARHGSGHTISPGEVNYRANIYALKMLGVERILAINACGSLREDFMPGHIVIPDQVFDLTRSRDLTFFGIGLVAHIGSANPFCPHLSSLVARATESAGGLVHSGGSLVIIEGPRFSTRAESNVYRSWGMSIVGMTCIPEVFLAREAEICYCSMAHITDYDVWHVSEAPVTVEMVVKTLSTNTALANEAIRHLIKIIPAERPCSCGSALADALITSPAAIPVETRKRLDLLVGKYLPTETQ
jgi:5'-methylthioadenosine phosphorylase